MSNEALNPSGGADERYSLPDFICVLQGYKADYGGFETDLSCSVGGRRALPA